MQEQHLGETTLIAECGRDPLNRGHAEPSAKPRRDRFASSAHRPAAIQSAVTGGHPRMLPRWRRCTRQLSTSRLVALGPNSQPPLRRRTER